MARCAVQEVSLVDSPWALCDLLAADGPRAELIDELGLFGPMIGSWDVVITNHRPDGEEIVHGEWHFGWALDGRAVLDVWIAPNRAVRARTGDHSGEWGVTIRVHDPSINAWRSTWIGPKHAVVMPFIGREEGGEIVLEGSFDPGLATRWIFSDIQPGSFRWRAVESTDDGASWSLRQEMAATRMEERR
jgi:hypothetical protein